MVISKLVVVVVVAGTVLAGTDLYARDNVPLVRPPAVEPDTPKKEGAAVACEGSTSQELTAEAWKGLEAKASDIALACTAQTIGRWYVQADSQQAAAVSTQCPKPDVSEKGREVYFRDNWALSDVATSLFIQGEALRKTKRSAEAREAYRAVVARYSCAYTWDQRGFFWKTADGAKEKLLEIEKTYGR